MRIILKDTDEVYALKELLTGASIEDFKLRKVFDYIKSPKEDGYRSLHLVFACNNGAGGIARFNLELQLRTRLQHDWSTALETAGSVFKMN